MPPETSSVGQESLYVTATFVLFTITIYGFLLLGYGTRSVLPPVAEWSRPLTKVFLIYITPLITLNSFWSIDFRNAQFLTLPLISVGLQSLSLVPALILVRALDLSREEKGSFVACSMFSNTGPTLGVFLCFILFGQEGLYLGSWYITLYIPYYYFVGFPLMSTLSGEGKVSIGDALAELVRNPVSIVPISSMAIGLTLNLAGVPRPGILNLIVTRFVTYLSTAGFSLAIGMGLDFRKSLGYIRHSLWISLIKFLLNPMISLFLVWTLGYFGMTSPLPLRVAFVESFMPTAILAVVLSKLFRLNEDLANAAWIMTTLLMVPVTPVIIWAQGLL
jgi:predicted permease